MQTKDQGLDASGIEACKRGSLSALMSAVSRLIRRRKPRPVNRLDHLDAHGLKDIGIEAQDAAHIAVAREHATRLLMMHGRP
ncbi:DUF1127 domain-containing protein [Rhizobium rhizophilum]|uniref:DUF1127 domain-containing protein n=1 Tax=Rhizobium rhizophilum TaxID=1850373 RepID=A0ABY2QUA4_9HYPH|nr:DUF1127 domain-containing protein [Rhizobium rhizophilum]THV14130.1 DUF1127 domain-containing protein [Rhizobium rhizophilum]